MRNLENFKYKFLDHIKCEVSNKNIFVLNSTHPSKKNTLKKKIADATRIVASSSCNVFIQKILNINE